MSLEGPHPSRHISSTPISLASASQMLETYLEHSRIHPHLHPDALITPTGVKFSSNGGSAGGIVMHNLRRVAAGLRGEYLEPEGTPEPEANDEGEDAEGGWARNKGGKMKKKRKLDKNEDDNGWQDKAEYEREQGGLEVGELGHRSNVVQDGGEEPLVEVAEDGQESGKKRKKGGLEDAQDAKLDKEARKLAKKARLKQERRDKEKARMEKAG